MLKKVWQYEQDIFIDYFNYLWHSAGLNFIP